MTFNENVRFEAALVPFLAILAVFLFLRHKTSAEVNRRFRILVVSTLAAMVFDVIVSEKSVMAALSPFAGRTLLTLSGIAALFNAYLLMRYVASYVGGVSPVFLKVCRLIAAFGTGLYVLNLFTGFFFTIGERGIIIHGTYDLLLRAGFVFFFLGCAFALQNLHQLRYDNAQFILMNLLLFLLLDAFVIQYLFAENIRIVYVVSTVLLFITFFYLEAPVLRDLLRSGRELQSVLNEAARSTERVHQASRAKSDFLANTSHEIRTPMNAILGMNDMILKESKDGDVLEAAHDIKRAGETLLSIINNILDISKIDSGKMELYPSDFFISELVRDLETEFRPRVEEKKLAFRVELNRNLPEHLHADEEALRRVIGNLLDNAVKYTEKGSVTLHVLGGAPWEEHDTEKHPDIREEGAVLMTEHAERIHIQFMVEDTGFGMRREEMNKLFEAFERVNLRETQSIQGAGLGLTLVWNLTRLMGGTVRAESVYGEGSAFTVDLPVKVVSGGFTGTIADYEEQLAAGKEKSGQEDGDAEEGLPSLPDCHILVVDDTPVNLTVAKAILERTSGRIDCAMSGEEALDMALSAEYDMIFLDLQMPGMDGLETLRHFREAKENLSAQAVVIALTAEAGAAKRYAQAGFDGFLEKPLQETALAKVLRKHMEGRTGG